MKDIATLAHRADLDPLHFRDRLNEILARFITTAAAVSRVRTPRLADAVARRPLPPVRPAFHPARARRD